MSVRKEILAIIIAAIAIVFNIVMLACNFNHGELFKVEYALSLVAILICIISMIAGYSYGGPTFSKFFGIPIPYIGAGTMIVQMIFCVVTVATECVGDLFARFITYIILLIGIIMMFVRKKDA